MSKIVFSNNASSLLAASIGDNDTTVQVTSTEGSLFPSPGVGEFFKVALVNAAGDLEICHCTSRSGDLLTVTRAQEGTSAQSWTNGVTRVELRNTKGTLEQMVQRDGDTLTGDLNFAGNEARDARLTGDTVMVGGQLVGTAIRGTEDDGSNEIVVPSDGSKATAGGSPILTADDGIAEQMPVGAIIMWYGSLGSLPTGWQLCDGSNGTPDMRGAFPRGAGGAYILGGSGGSATASGNTGAGGGHTPTGSVDGHALTEDEMPSHSHGILGTNSTSGVVDENFHGGNMNGVPAVYNAGGTESHRSTSSAGNPLTEAKGGGNAHSHSLTMNAVADHTHSLASISTLPPYKQLYFIMKVS